MTAGDYLGDCIDPGWRRAVKVGPTGKAVLFYDDGTVRFAHRCDRGERGIIDCSPLLQIGPGHEDPGPGHEIVSEDPLTIRPSILCPDCGTHGWFTESRWSE
jgi:hypothetical protein